MGSGVIFVSVRGPWRKSRGTASLKYTIPAYFWLTRESPTADRVYFNEAALPVYLPELHTLAFIKVLLVTHDALQLHLQDTSGEENNKLAISLSYFWIFFLVKSAFIVGRTGTCSP